MDVARDDQDLLVVTENGYGKRTRIDQYRKTCRGAMGVKTIKLTEAKGGLAGALVVREHQELVFISQDGHGPAHRRARHLAAGPRGDRRARDERARRRPASRAVALVVESEPDDGADELPLERQPDLGPEGNGASHEPEALGGRRRRRRRRRGRRGGRPRTATARPERRPRRRRRRSLHWDHQRKEVVRTLTDSSCGTLEVSGR